MATLADVQFSMQGEQQRNQDSVMAETRIIENLRASNEVGTKFYVFKLVSNTRKGGVHVPGIDDVINPNTGKMERIRLLSGVDTIWLKEQKDVTPEYAKMNQRNLSFVRGTKILRIPEWDHTALEFARLTKHNVGSPNNKTGSQFEFYEYNPAREAEELMKKDMLELEMAILAKEMPEDEMRKHAAFLGIRLIDDLGLPKVEEAIRREYILTAKRRPEYFQRTVKSKEVEISWIIRRAIIDNKIDIKRQENKVYWAQGGGLIGAYARNENPENYLVNLALSNTQEGNDFKQQLQRIVQ
jgi:hypothetical protein